MDLATHQRKLLGLVKRTYTASDEDDEYIRRAGESRGLEMVREIALWWRGYSLETYCVLTSRLLKQLNLFDQVVERMFKENVTSAFVESLGLGFLDKLALEPQALVASVARFEASLLRVKQGSMEEYVVEWDQHPLLVLQSLLSNAAVVTDAYPGLKQRFRTIVSGEIPELFRVDEA